VGADDAGNGVSRRDALKTGAVVGAAAFVVPVVGTISLSQASAQTPSHRSGGDDDQGDNDQGDNNNRG
jgi:hypothetical protein